MSRRKTLLSIFVSVLAVLYVVSILHYRWSADSHLVEKRAIAAECHYPVDKIVWMGHYDAPPVNQASIGGASAINEYQYIQAATDTQPYRDHVIFVLMKPIIPSQFQIDQYNRLKSNPSLSYLAAGGPPQVIPAGRIHCSWDDKSGWSS